jgi:hypothetical protein
MMATINHDTSNRHLNDDDNRAQDAMCLEPQLEVFFLQSNFPFVFSYSTSSCDNDERDVETTNVGQPEGGTAGMMNGRR